jgi:hypothetical protein
MRRTKAGGFDLVSKVAVFDGVDAPPTALVCHSGGVEENHLREASMGEVSTIGLDLAKNVFVRPASRVSFCFTGGI